MTTTRRRSGRIVVTISVLLLSLQLAPGAWPSDPNGTPRVSESVVDPGLDRPLETDTESPSVGANTDSPSTEAPSVKADTDTDEDSPEGDASDGADAGLRAWFARWDVRGRWRLRGRHRRAGDESDTDLEGFGTLHATLPGTPGQDEAPGLEVSANLTGAFDLDLDSFERSPFRSGATGSPFADLGNTYDHRFHGDLTSAWVQVRSGDRTIQGRVGRQSLPEVGGFLFDGARLDLRPAPSSRMQWTVQAGVPTHLYESSPDGDLLAGTQGSARIAESVDATAGYVYVRDRNGYVGSEGDHHAFGKLRWRPTPSWIAQAGVNAIDFEAFRESLDVGWSAPERTRRIRLRFVHQDPLDRPYTTELSPYFRTLGRLDPYVQAHLDGEAELVDGVWLGAGVSARELVDGARESTFNRSFRNAFVQASLDELPWKGFAASVRGDVWDSGKGDIVTTGFEVSQRVASLTQVSAGTEYSLYRIDLFTGTERQRDRVWFVELERAVGETFQVGLRYVLENDERDDYQTFVVLVTQSF